MNRRCGGLRVFLANLLWFLSCLPGWIAFLLASRNVKRAQTKVLTRILRRNAATEIGERQYSLSHERNEASGHVGLALLSRHSLLATADAPRRSSARRKRRPHKDGTPPESLTLHNLRGFASSRDPDAFQAVPLSDYEDYVDSIDRIQAGQASVLTRDPVELLHPTSGSTAATKLIPYTASLRREFQAAIDPWIASLYLAHPSVLLGRHYWSISPATRPPPQAAGKVRIGFADDADYLGVFQRWLSRALFVVPPEMARVQDPAAFEYLTLLFLLREKGLRVISVWHPSFLTLLTRAAPGHLPAIANDIEAGTISGSVVLPPDLRRSLNAQLYAHPARARELRQSDTARPDFPGFLWPRLRLISCWTEGRSEPWLSDLRRQFPRAAIQGKGLTATEGIVSFPLGAEGRKVCAIRSHFFEFLDSETGHIKRAWEVEPGGEYSIVLTTGGGLYRYRLHDLVKVTGFFNRAPCLEFVSRDNLVSDVVGEKLNGKHVEESIRKVEANGGVRFAFAMLAPDLAAQTVGYVFYAQAADGSEMDYQRAGVLLEQELGRNFHYRHARALSQLQPLRVVRVDGDAATAYRRFLMLKGTKAGDLKFNVLSPDAGWGSAFEGEYVV